MNWPIFYFLLWGGTACLSACFVRCCISVAPRLGFLDIPLHEAHKRHRRPVPVLGGLGMLLGWLGMLLGGFVALRFFPHHLPQSVQTLLPGIKSVGGRFLLIVAAAAGAVLLGTWDDHTPLKALPKFGGQVLIAILLVVCGLKISFLHPCPGANELFTILWILTVMNALNFFDNMDGLAAGAGMIAAFVFLFVACHRGQYFVATLASLTGGAATGFFCFNAPPRARICMGDGGSHFLGVLLATCGILTTYYIPGENPTPAPLLIPLCALGVPLFDAVAVVLIRLRLHKPIYIGDNRHISHRFEHLGLTRPQAVLCVHLLGASVAMAGLTLLWLPASGFLLVFLLLAALFTLISVLQFYLPEVRENDNHHQK